MRNYPIPFNETERLAALAEVAGLRDDNSALFDHLSDMVRQLFDCPIGHISVVEDEGQWYKSVVGMELGPMPKEHSFCVHTIMSDDVLVVPDLSKDPRFADHPMVAEGGPGARFYAGVPLVLNSGYRIGSICALDVTPHEAPTPQQLDLLRTLGKTVVAALEKAPAEGASDAPPSGPSTFIDLVGHELRTPITVMLGGLRLIEATGAASAASALAKSARRSAEHLDQLVETIIRYSNAATHELLLHEQTAGLKALLEEVVDIHRPSAEDAEKSLVLDQDVPDIDLQIDTDQIKLALTALLLNAHVHGGRYMTVRAAFDADGHLEIVVTDDGKLDDKLDLQELYKPFVVGSRLPQRGTQGGLGLGLPLTRKLVELHGGEFEVRPLAHATEAVIRLPKWRMELAKCNELLAAS
ncbi:GAF domain-containing protein [Roseivivax sp. THAF30]|uniref:GAF domain-containing sensor histidine kinase n=1 Tax=Roseivivax sp. THAF30 TaxID=2587852 RepID=UPI0012683D5B|nr:GAF domain-containing protein [Roseivivax sp. THAF30]QFT64447.1 Virulence sensor protein BvgS precursor [Roseivivax sp. THAF30]